MQPTNLVAGSALRRMILVLAMAAVMAAMMAVTVTPAFAGQGIHNCLQEYMALNPGVTHKQAAKACH